MAKLTFLKNYNNYYNRIIKNNKKQVINNYSNVSFNNINFDVADGIHTTQVVNWDQTWTPDYMIVDLQSNYVDTNWVNYLNGFYFARTYNYYPVDIHGTNAQVKEELHHFPVWDEDYEEYVYRDYLRNDETILDTGMIYSDFKGEINWNYYQFGMDFESLPVSALRMILSDKGDSDYYANIFVQFSSPNTYTMIRSIDIPGDVIDYTLLKQYIPDLPNDALISNIQFDPNNQDDPTDSQYCPTHLSAGESQTLAGDNTYTSSWFVTEFDKIRGKQYKATLRRDVVENNLDGLKNCVANIDRCIIDQNNPLIYNKEPFQYNQIKKDEIPVYDRTYCPWIIGYMDSEAAHSYTDDQAIVISEDYDVDLSSIAYDAWTYHDLIGKDIKHNIRLVNTAVTISWNDFWGGGIIGGRAYQNQNSAWYTGISGSVGTNNEAIRYSESNFNNVKNNSYRYGWYSWTSANTKLLENVTESDVISSSDLSNLRSLNGKKVKFSDGIYTININSVGDRSVTKEKQDNSLATLVLDGFQNHVSGDKKHNYLDYTYKYDRYTLSATPVTTAVNKIEFTLTTSSNKLIDAPYRMFAIPLPSINGAPDFSVSYSNIARPCDKDLISTLVQHLIVDLGNHLFDIQLLPYCPVEFSGYSYSSVNNKLTATMPSTWSEHVDYDWITYTESSTTYYRGIVLYPKESSFKFTVDRALHNGSQPTYSYLFDISDKKIQNETEFARLCSPNYASVFEFSPAMNEGIQAINVACTYKPFNPFIVVAPQFGGLYGKDYNDNRGLVLAGDYSLAQVSDAWIEFQIQNKSYSEAFKREITSMEREYEIQKQEAGWQIAGGTLTGAASGALTGGMIGGGYGAAAGAVIGGATSLVGGIMDYTNLEKRQTEALNYRKDMFNFQLQNIKAKPDTLEKTSSINANSKYVPFIEKYDCTDEEKALLREYLKYNGYTAGFCGPIDMTGFVRANIIRYNDYIDTLELMELNEELKKGVYL